MKNLDERELPVEEIRNRIKRPSGFWVKWGTLIILLFFLLLIAASLFIKYPATVRCNLSLSKGAQQYTIESFNGDGEIIYCEFPSKETHITVNDTVLFIEAKQKEKIYARITLPQDYEKELELKKGLKIMVMKQSLESAIIHATVSSIYHPINPGAMVLNIEISDRDSDFFSDILQSKEITIPVEMLLNEKSIFSRIFAKVKEVI